LAAELEAAAGERRAEEDAVDKVGVGVDEVLAAPDRLLDLGPQGDLACRADAELALLFPVVVFEASGERRLTAHERLHCDPFWRVWRDGRRRCGGVLLRRGSRWWG